MLVSGRVYGRCGTGFQIFIWKVFLFGPCQEATLGVQPFRLAAAGQELSVSLVGSTGRDQGPKGDFQLV